MTKLFFWSLTVALVTLPALADAAPIGTTAIWSFDLPATAVASQDPPYPTVATLTLTQTAAGVQFVLDPNESIPGAWGVGSFVERLDYAYDGPALTAGSFQNDTFPAGSISGFQYVSNPNNMDAGYKANVFHIVVDFPSKNDVNRFNPDETRTWTVLGSNLEQFDDTFATSGPKPSPIHGVISVTAYSLEDPKPTPSNWVAGADPTLVPEPSTLLLLGTGLAAVGLRRRRQTK